MDECTPLHIEVPGAKASQSRMATHTTIKAISIQLLAYPPKYQPSGVSMASAGPHLSS